MAHPRPGTSGGVPTKGSSRVNVDKRMSKDDMFFNTARYKHSIDKRMSRDDSHIKSRSTFMSQYRVPVGGSTITPKQSPLSPVTREVSIPSKVQIAESTTSGDIPIGMAIGSPSLSTPDSSKRPAQLPLASNPPMIASQSSAAAAASTGSLQRKKTGRRKLLGLFGSGRKSENAQGPGLADATTEQPSTTTGRLRGASASSVQVSAKGTPARSNTQTERKLSKHKPNMIRSQTMPYSADESATTTEEERAGRPNLRSKASESNIRPGIPHQRSRAIMASAVPPVPSFLDIQIPDTTLERYSVMFSDVLNEAPKQETAVSLLVRRQATLESLKRMNGTSKAEEVQKETPRLRRATSPARNQSPKLTLFPMPPAGRITPGLDTPKTQPRLTRANTSPGILPSPTQASFDTRQGPTSVKTPHAKTLTVPNPFDGTPSPTKPKPGKKEPDPIYPTDTGFHFGPDESGSILESPIDIEASEEIIVSQPFKPTLHEPQWQMVSPPTPATASESSPKAPSVLSSATSGGRRRSPSIASSARTHATKPSSEIDDADAAFQNAVKDSIARQISISRQQRALLRPLQIRRATGGPVGAAVGVGTTVMSPLGSTVGGEWSSSSSSSPTRRVLAEDKAIRETKIATPTLVNPREQAVNPAHLAQNRKSSWAVVEGE